MFRKLSDFAKAHVNAENFLGMAEYDKARSDFITALSWIIIAVRHILILLFYPIL